MNMSEEVTGVTLQVAEKAVSTAAQTASSILEHIARLLRELVVMQRERERAKGGKAADKPRGTDLTDIKPGEVDVKKLITSARRTGDTISVSEQGLTQEDVKAITLKAKKYGIPVAFTNTERKDNIIANVRTNDLPIFKQICTECVKEQMAERPQTLGNFKCQPWEMPFIRAELNACNLSAQFVTMSNGDHLCVFNAKEEKAFEIAHKQFAKKFNELNNDLHIQTDEKGFCVIRDQRIGKEISFDEMPHRETLISQMQSVFGYDENKARMAATKFGEEVLKGKANEDFFSTSAQNDFSEAVANIELKSDSILTRQYSCWQLTAKEDQVQRIVFRNDAGEFAVLRPDKQTRKQMREALTEQLGITDREELDALVEKAERVHSHYLGTKNELYHQTARFHASDFDMSNPETADHMRRIDADGTVFTKKQPIDELENAIERTAQDKFQVKTFCVSTEFDNKGTAHSDVHNGQIELSISDKRKSIADLIDFYKKQGVPESAAKQMAKEVFRKASMQSIEKVVQIEEVKESSITVSVNGEKAAIPAPDRAQAVEAIVQQCGVPKETAEQVVAKADELKSGENEHAAEQTASDADKKPEPVTQQKKEWEKAFPTDREHILRSTRQYDGSYHLMDSKNNHGEFIRSDPLPDGSFYIKINPQAFKGETPFYESTTEIVDDFFEGAHHLRGEITDMTPARVRPVPFKSGEYEVVEKGKIQQEETEYSLAEAAEKEQHLGGNGHEMHPEGNMLAGESVKPDVPSLPNGAPEFPKAPELPKAPEFPPPSLGGRR